MREASDGLAAARVASAPAFIPDELAAAWPGLVEVEGVWRAMIDLLALPVVVHDERGRVVHANQAFADLTEYPLLEVFALSAGDLIHPGDRSARDELASRLESGDLDQTESDRRLLTRAGKTLRVHAQKAALTVGGHRLVMVCIQDVGMWHAQVEQLSHTAGHDELTQAFNRAGLVNEMNRFLLNRVSGRVALIDINELKKINDTHGHAAGDRVLRGTADQLQAADPAWVVARWGGDEFVVVATVSQPLRSRIVAALNVHISVGRQRVAVTAAVGETQFGPGDGLDGIVHRADLDMYRHKNGSPLAAELKPQ